MKDGEEQFRHNMDFIVSCARSNRKTPAFETTGEIITRIAISLNLHSHLHQSKLPAVVEAHIRELEKLVKPVEVGYPAFPHHVMEGTSLYEGLALPVSKTSAKHPEFLWMAAMVMELAYLFGRVAIKNHARIPYGMQLHIIGDLRRSHKSSAVEVAMDYMFRAGGTKNDSASLDRASVDGRVLIQTGGSLEGCGLRMAELGVCRCLLFYDELRKLADKAGIEGSSMVSDLLSVADAGQWANRVKRGKESFAFAPHEYCLSLITCCATEAFQDCWSRLSGSSISGLNERAFILLQPAAPKEQKRALDPDYEPAEITKSLIRKAEAQKVFDTAADAEAILDSAVNSLGVQWTSRMELLSLYFAVDLGREVIDADCVQRTEALCSYGKKALEYIRPIDAESKLAALQQKIIQALRRSPEHKLELRTLKKNLHFERYDTEMCDRALKGLQKTMPPTITIDGEQPYWVKLIWEE